MTVIRSRAAYLAVALAITLAACGSSSTSTSGSSSAPSTPSTGTGGGTSAGQPQRGGNLVIARHADSLSMDPTTIVDNETIWVLEQMYEGLYAPSRDGKTALPRLATGYALSPDKLTWTFPLRPGVRFNNGSPLTAADVVFSLNRARAGAGFGYIDGAIKSITASNDHTVVIRTKFQWAPLLADLAIFDNGIIPNNYAGKTKAQFFAHPITTGPFMLDHWAQASELKMVRNPYYWQAGKPYLDSVTWTVVSDDNARMLQLRGGQVQVDEFPPYSAIGSLRSTPGVTVSLFPSTRVDYIMMNELAKPYQDVHVRRAIAYALDPQAIVRAVLFGFGRPANSYLPYQMNFYDASTTVPAHDLAKAKSEMALSSVPNGFSTQFLVGGTDVTYSSIAQIVQQELQPLGIKVSIQKIDPNNLLTEQSKYHYQISIDYWTNDIVDPDEATAFDLDPIGGGAQSFYTHYNNPAITALIHKAEQEFDPAVRQGLYSQIQRIAAQDLPLIPLVYQGLAYAYSPSLQNFFVSPLGIYALGDVWIKR